MQTSTYNKRVNSKHISEDAPNIFIDDVKPATPINYAGEIKTPTLSRVANLEIRYNRFHSTAMCFSTRVSLLTRRNRTLVGNGQISEFVNDWDNFSGIIPKTSATVAKILKEYRYNTSAFGKWHNKHT